MCRSLRKLEDLHLQRLRVDIKDFQPAGVEGLNSGQKPWVATGKHLCGAATDFTLRCCASSMQGFSRGPQQLAGAQICQLSAPERAHSASSTPCTSHDAHGDSRMQSAEELELGSPTEKRHLPSAEQGSSRGETKMTDTVGIEGCSSETHSADAAEDSMGCHGLDDQVSGEAGVQGFAIATCCHHRCSWQHYVGKPLFECLGFSPDEFEIISWMTGAVMLS